MRSKIFLAFGLLVVAFAAGYVLSQSSDNNDRATSPSNQSTAPEETTSSGSSVKDTVSYTLPDGWMEQACPASSAVFVIPSGSTANCDDSPVSPVKISIDSGNNTDCNQLQGQSQVKKHTCISEFINNKKTLKASTEFLASSSYGKETVVDAYYFDSGAGVVLAEYIHSPNDNEYQISFEKLAKSLSVK